MLRFYDKNNVDITDELNNPSIFCGTVELEWGRLEQTGTVELDREQAGTASWKVKWVHWGGWSW